MIIHALKRNIEISRVVNLGLVFAPFDCTLPVLTLWLQKKSCSKDLYLFYGL